MVNGGLYVLGGRPAMGKTLLALNLMEEYTIKRKKKVLYISLEMCTENLIRRLSMSLAKVGFGKVQEGDEKSLSAMENAKEILCQCKYIINDNAGITVAEIEELIKSNQDYSDVDLMIIDNIHLLKGPVCSSEREEQEIITRSLRQISSQMGITILILCKTKKKVDIRKDHRPLLSDIKYPALVQVADVVMLLYRPAYYKMKADRREAELIIAKNRFSDNCVMKLNYWEEYSHFSSTEDLFDEYVL